MIGRINAELRRVPVWLVWCAGLLPLLWVVWLLFSGGLGVDPVKGIEHWLGKIGLWFLIGGLAITPLRRFAGLNLLRYRRAVGLLAFLYISLHLLVWFLLDMAMLWGQATGDLVRRPYLILGILAYLMLTPLALTSNRVSIRRMGRGWIRLHRLAYPAAGLAVLHYLWQMKVIRPEGWIWLLVLVVLLLSRLQPASPVAAGGRRGDSTSGP